VKRLFIIAVALLTMLALAAPVGAITKGGELDDGEHPFVGISIYGFDTPDGFAPAWRCSGTLVAPTVYVTAGHCTFGADTAVIWMDEFETDIRAGGYPFDGGTGVTGTPYTHPGFEGGPWFLYDFGVVILDSPIYMDEYGEMPYEGELSDYIADAGNGRKGATLEAVGYGVQRTNPALYAKNLEERDLDRRKADLMVVNYKGLLGIGHAIPDQFVVLSGDAAHGGTCFGDSGGPNFIGDTNVIGAVTSFGLNGNCAGISGNYRIDQPDDLNWFWSNFSGYMTP
jgi:V8-like Glu-specific endopeptidase